MPGEEKLKDEENRIRGSGWGLPPLQNITQELILFLLNNHPPLQTYHQTLCVLPVIILEELTGVEPVDSPDIEPILAWSFTMGSDRQRMTEKPMNDKQNKLRPQIFQTQTQLCITTVTSEFNTFL